MTNLEKENKFHQIFSENKNKIYRLCYGSLSNKADVDDLFQEVMINAWNNLESFRGEAKASTWLYRIAVNTAFLYNKKYSKQTSRIINYEFEKLDESPNNFNGDKDEQLEKLHECISKLNKQDRIIVALFLEGFSYDEISELIGITVNYVGVKLNRIKALLTKCVEEEDND